MGIADIKMAIIRMFFPDRCLFCDRTVEPGVVSCAGCEGSLPICHEVAQGEDQSDVFEWQAAAFWYSGVVRHGVEQFKFNKRTDAAAYFAPLMHEAILRSCKGEFLADLVVPVPMGENRLRERGYNQAELLSRELSHICCIPHAPEVLCRQGNLVQHELSARLRRLEAESSFMLASNAEGKIYGKSILLVDDISTTGSTLKSCAKAMLKGGADKIFCVTIAATPLK